MPVALVAVAFDADDPARLASFWAAVLGRRIVDDVGLFWRDALEWPFVWDHNEQTAVQSPRGGTKLSWDTWPEPTPTETRLGGPPLAPKHHRNRQRFDLIAPDLAAEVERLVTLGATEVGDRHTGVELADPDGNEFTISPA